MHPDRTNQERRIALSGASGLIGRRLAEHLAQAGWRVCPLVRRQTQLRGSAIYWNPERNEVDAEALNGLDAVVHLAGENLAGLWTRGKKAALWHSRVDGTALLCQALQSVARPPAVFLAASAVGFYGDRGDETLDERSTPGVGFLAQLCRKWEAATQDVADAGVRVVNLRFGLVLAREGGVLGSLLRPFKLGLGCRIGSGRQFVSWITREDAIRAIDHALNTAALRGPLNIVAPNPVCHGEFVRTLARVLQRPMFLRVPALVVRAMLGEMGREMLLPSTRAVPHKLQESGFAYQHVTLENALRAELALPQQKAGGQE